MVYEIANENAKKDFIIPVTWSVFDKVKVQANSLEEAYNYVKDNMDTIPLGDNEEYVDGSYDITGDIDECVIYQDTKDIICLEFDCEDELSKYIDSMLFDSDESVAHGRFVYKNKEIDISLRICGEVSVSYKNETYHRPSEFPEELKEKIRKNPYQWETDKDICVFFNNWFEYIYDSTDGMVCEDDVSKMTPEQILSEMTEIASEIIK